MIEIQALRKSYRKSLALDGFSMQIQPDELVGIVGPNGAGKTTLIKILATLLRADSGAVRVAGHDVASNPAAVPASVGYLHDVAGILRPRLRCAGFGTRANNSRSFLEIRFLLENNSPESRSDHALKAPCQLLVLF